MALAVAATDPNPPHIALVALSAQKFVTLVTQNVDGLHQRAGSRDVIELHGNMFANKWLDGCGLCDPATAVPGMPPRCSLCNATMRPGVVWLGEELPRVARYRAEHATENCDRCIVVGTSLSGCGPARCRQGPWRACHRGQSRAIGLDQTADIVLRGPAGGPAGDASLNRFAAWIPRAASAFQIHHTIVQLSK